MSCVMIILSATELESHPVALVGIMNINSLMFVQKFLHLHQYQDSIPEMYSLQVYDSNYIQITLFFKCNAS